MIRRAGTRLGIGVAQNLVAMETKHSTAKEGESDE